MKNKIIKQETNWVLLITLFLIAILIAVVSMIRTPQNTQKGAYFSNATVSLLPSSGNYNVGDYVPVAVFVNSPNAKVDQVDATVCFDKTKIKMDNISTDIAPETASGFMFVDPFMSEDDSCVRVAFLSNSNPESLKSGAVKVGVIKLKAIASGKVDVNLKQNIVVAGDNNESPTDKSIKVDSIANASYVILGGNLSESPTPTLTPAPTLTPTSSAPGVSQIRFKVVFTGIRDFSDVNTTCAKNMKVSVKVVTKDQQERVFTNVNVNKVGSFNREGVVYAKWEGEIDLGNFVPTGSVAMLIKGPKHVQMKYGDNNQSTYFNQALGNLNIVPGLNVFDFSNYPILPGDVVGTLEGDNNPDGIVNGVDYTFVKNSFGTNNLQADLDFDCAMSTQDLQLLKLTLNERQSQKY